MEQDEIRENQRKASIFIKNEKKCVGADEATKIGHWQTVHAGRNEPGTEKLGTRRTKYMHFRSRLLKNAKSILKQGKTGGRTAEKRKHVGGRWTRGGACMHCMCGCGRRKLGQGQRGI
ncbi:MAG: hypothetical protein ACLTDV_00105 [Eubacterium sp.]